MTTPVIRSELLNNLIGNFASFAPECNPVQRLHAGSDARSVVPRDEASIAD